VLFSDLFVKQRCVLIIQESGLVSLGAEMRGSDQFNFFTEVFWQRDRKDTATIMLKRDHSLSGRCCRWFEGFEFDRRSVVF
jgi:hypothetical protein